MTRDEFRAILTPLVLAMRADFDVPTWAAYYQTLHDVPAEVLEAMVAQVQREPREFFPKAGELRAACERTRRQILALDPWSPCVECEDQPGWRAVLDAAGTPRVQRCPCKVRYQSRFEARGLWDALSPLPGEVGAGDERLFPTLEQLPTPVREQLTTIAGQKVLR